MTLQPVNRYALKEWAVVIGALISGHQSLLFRKGGITEDWGDFAVEYKEFFLYPTFLHEAAERIIPEAAKDLDALLSAKPSEAEVVLSAYGVVVRAIKVRDLEQLRQLRPYHILSADEIEKRFYYRDKPGLHVLLLRTYQLSEPYTLAVTREYAGCKSWVDLRLELSTAGCRPILSDEAFYQQVQVIRSILT